ncbi:MAG: MoxR family ATPase [Proteobacteria bacterium]|nr:MoxR family ATPase [Pseudomonadota bacterium]
MHPSLEPLPRERATELCARLVSNVERALRGKPEVVRRAVTTWVAQGHLLLEDVPGVGKTTLARALAHSVEADFHRIQFTSDLLPSDLTGLSLPEFDGGRAAGRFVFQPGPIFAHVVLADEVNRASPKSQSALLEAMSDRSGTVDGVTHALPDPFLVVATQNPLEHHGTHPLPESQLDRFLMRLAIGYPEPEFEAAVLREDPATNTLPSLEPVLTLDELRGVQRAALQIKFDDGITSDLLALVQETREHESLHLGVSPRGALALRRAAQARALLDDRDYCIPEDVRDLVVDVLAHRVSVDPRGPVSDGDTSPARWILQEILERVPVPL